MALHAKQQNGNDSSGGGGVADVTSTSNASGGAPSSSTATATNTAAGSTTAGSAASGGAAASGAVGGGGGGGGVPVQSIAMKLLDLRLKPSSAILASLSGEFTGAGRHEIVVLKVGGAIEIHRITQTTTSTSNRSKNRDGDDDDDDDDDEPITRTTLKVICRYETRSNLRCCSIIRYPGEKYDVIAIGSDAGTLSILDFEHGVCKIIHCISYGKTGCRRSTPGQYVASDPKGRAVMISAIEKRKLVYVLNRDATGKPTIASPLEAHRTRTLTYDSIGIDNGFDNPIFANIELQYPDTEDDTIPIPSVDHIEKQLAYYELDLGLNHVSRRWTTTIHRTACCLAAIPGGADGPGGCLVGSEDYIEYIHENMPDAVPVPGGSNNNTNRTSSKIVCAIPRRLIHPKGKGILITTMTVHRQKKSKFFALAQSELGDVYKVTLRLNNEDKSIVDGMDVALLDTLPPCNSLNVSKLGMLFAAAEFGDHQLYQFERIDLPDAPTSTSEQYREAFGQSSSDSNNNDADALFMTTENATQFVSTFQPTMLKNLRKVYSIENPAPTTGVMVGELAGNEVSPQIYTLTGRGPHSALRILRHGASVVELALSQLPGVPAGIKTIADNSAEAVAAGVKNDKYIVISFADATLVLSVGETVEEVGKESGFLANAPTLACSALGNDGAVCQVHPSGVRQIQRGQAKQWHCPGLKRIECASANESQVIIALAGGEVIYFELDPMSGNLTESATRDMGADVCCLDVGMIGQGRTRSLFAAVGCRDQTVRIVSLEPTNLLVQRSSTALKSRPHSVSLQMMIGTTTDGDGSSGTTTTAAVVAGNSDLTLTIGLDDGSSLRANVDPITGGIGTSPTRRFLGARPVSVSKIYLESQSAALLLSSRAWISRRDTSSGKYIMAPLSYAPLDHGCSFCSNLVHEGIVATAGKTLRILSIDTSGMAGNNGDDESFNTNKVDLRYTPRQMTLMSTTTPSTNGGNGAPDQRKVVLVVVESDYNDYGLEAKKAMGIDSTGLGKNSKKDGSGDKGDDDAMDMEEDSDDEGNNANKAKNKDGSDNDDDDDDDAEEKEARKTPIRGPIPPGPGHWGSCIRLLDPAQGCLSLDSQELGRNEAALCCACVRFHSKGGEPLLAVGTVTGMSLNPIRVEQSAIVLYRVYGNRFQLLHRTIVDDGPILAMAHYQGRLLVGIGTSLRLYEMGKRQLLRKCERRSSLSPTTRTYIKTIQTVGDRAYIGDMMNSIQVIRYDTISNRLILIATDPSPRPIVSQELLDWCTVAIGDKFGNISILRLPRGADNFSGTTSDGGGNHRSSLWDSSNNNNDSTIPKLELLANYYIGEVVCSMTRCSLVAGGSESLIYVTVSGRIGALVPFTSRDDVEFYTQLETYMRTVAPRYTGRNPQKYRSYYSPTMHIIDGDLCDTYNSLNHNEQNNIATKLDRNIGEIIKKLEDTRNSLL